MNHNIIKKVTAIVLTACMLFSVASCSEIFIERCKAHIEEYVEEFMLAVAEDYETAFEEYSKASVDVPELDSMQAEYFSNYINDISGDYTLKIKLDDSRKSAEVTITFPDAFIPDENIVYIGNQDTIDDLISDTRAKDVSVSLSLKRVGSDWQFQDLSDVCEEIVEPYQVLNFLGDDGFPLEITDAFLNVYTEENYVGCRWSVPPSDDEDSMLLQCTFDFTCAQNVEFEARLLLDGNVVDSQDVVVDNDDVADAIFSISEIPGDDSFFVAELLVRDIVIASSDEMNMSQTYIGQYVTDNYVDCLWYDPIQGNPISGDSLDADSYLECVFYFNKPQNIEFVASLMCDGNEVMSQEMTLNGEVIADCNFGYDTTDTTFAPGSYTVVLYMWDMAVVESPVLTVR